MRKIAEGQFFFEKILDIFILSVYTVYIQFQKRRIYEYYH